MKRLMITTAILLALAIVSFTLIAQQDERWRHHTCAPGEKDYNPGHALALQKKTSGYDVDLTIGPEDWYDPAPIGREAKDWLKAAGVSYLNVWRPATYAKNHLSALVGFRMRPDQQFEVCAYVNDLAGGHRFDGVVLAAVGDTVSVGFRLEGDTAKFVLTHRGKRVEVAFPDFMSVGRQVGVGPWHGGTLPAPFATGIGTRFRWVD